MPGNSSTVPEAPNATHEAMRRLWTEPVVDFASRWVRFEGCRLNPKPVQKSHVPIIVGGYAEPPSAAPRASAPAGTASTVTPLPPGT